MRQDRALAMFERLGGSEIKEVAARWFDNPNPVSAEEYRRRCLPYYNPAKGDPDVFSRTIFAKTSASISGEMRSDGSISSRKWLGSAAPH
jgi:hypothetical protein